MDEDIREEQAAELEALDAIFGDDYQILDEPTEDTGARFQVHLTDDADTDVKIRVIFTHTDTYPRTPIATVVHALSGVSAPRRKELQEHLEGVARDNEDMPAAYTICEAARDWLANHIVDGGGGGGSTSAAAATARGGRDGRDDEDSKHRFETLDATQQEKVEVISSKAVGTPVTVETFAAWREQFVQELEQLKSKEERDSSEIEKLTGREYFESRTAVVSAESESFWEAEALQSM